MTLLRIGMRAPVAEYRYGEVTPEQGDTLADFLSLHNGRPVQVTFNSAGGIATQGAADAAEVERHGRVVAWGTGIIASAATLPFLAAARRVLHPDCLLMIHQPSALVLGTSDDMRAAADALGTMDDAYAEAYSRRTGHPVELILQWMAAETWMNAADALALRFCDAVEAVIGAEPPAVSEPTLNAYRNAPAMLGAHLKGKTHA